jgi:SAM-dependent methyltransferase
LSEVPDHTIVFAPANPWILMADLDPCPSRWCKVSGIVARNQWPNEVKDKVQWARFTASYNQFQIALEKSAEPVFRLDPSQLFPCLDDEVENHPIDSHYLYHPAWAVRKLIEYKINNHYDFGSTLHFASMASAITRVTLHDLRPPKISLSNLECRRCDLMQIDYPDDSLPSISCMHTIEHIGLGRYGDKLNPIGDRIAASELSRVLKPGGLLFFVAPVGYPRLQFNAHRIYSFELVLSLFPRLALLEHSLIPDNAIDIGMLDQPSAAIIDSQIHGCGCFVFRKPEKI